MNNNLKFFNLIILDESGSMNDVKRPTIEGFNETVQTIKGAQQQHPEEEHYVTLVSFNGLGIKTLISNEPAAQMNQIAIDRYQPSASTPLYDAMGFAIQRLRTQLELIKTYRVFVTVFTDGYENASKEFTGKAIKQLVEELKKQQWNFTYIGANHDVNAFAKSISIDNTMQFESNAESISNTLAEERSSRIRHYHNMRQQAEVDNPLVDPNEIF